MHDNFGIKNIKKIKQKIMKYLSSHYSSKDFFLKTSKNN